MAGHHAQRHSLDIHHQLQFANGLVTTGKGETT
jgi:hypothetical protein